MALFDRRKTSTTVKPQDVAFTTTATPTIRTKLLLRVDKHLDGPFGGLYSLTTIDKDGTETTVIDANTKRFIIIRMQKLLVGVD